MLLDGLDKVSTRVILTRERRGEGMTFKFSTIAMIVAAVIFLVAAIGVSLGSIGLVPLGLAVLAAGFVLAEWKM